MGDWTFGIRFDWTADQNHKRNYGDLQDLVPAIDGGCHEQSEHRWTYQFPAGSAGESYVVFAYYLVHTGFMEQRSPLSVIPGVPQSPVTSYVQNGSWVVDHFSTKGAKLVTDFWEQHLLNGSDTAQLLKQVGNYVWEDRYHCPPES